jgi:hypothetical protein
MARFPLPTVTPEPLDPMNCSELPPVVPLYTMRHAPSLKGQDYFFELFWRTMAKLLNERRAGSTNAYHGNLLLISGAGESLNRTRYYPFALFKERIPYDR